MWLCEEQQRSSSMVLIRRLQQRCGLGRGARTSREKRHWRLWGLPSAATAYSRMPLSPSPWGMAGPQNIWENNHFHPTITTNTLPFSCPWRLGRQTGGVTVCFTDVCVLLSDVPQNYVIFDILNTDVSHSKKCDDDKSRDLLWLLLEAVE